MNTFETYRVYVIDELINMNGNEIWKPVYVGCTNNITDRWSEHQKPGFANRLINAAILSKGVSNFRFRVVSQGLDLLEQHNIESTLMIAMNTAAPNGYNKQAPRNLQMYFNSLSPTKEYQVTLRFRDKQRRNALAMHAAKK